MTKPEAISYLKLAGYTTVADNLIFNSVPYVHWDHGAEVCLDGDFPIRELEAIAIIVTTVSLPS